MEFTGLQYFCTVVEEGSISKAAERLYITQQSLSGYISRLEKNYGCVFFERRPAFRLTMDGEKFYFFARRVIAENASLLESMGQNSGMPTRLPIGISYNNERCLIPQICHEFHAERPNILLSVIMTDRKLEERNLRSMDVYCNISTSGRRYPGITSEFLLQNTFFAVIPRCILQSHPEIVIGKKIPLWQVVKLPIVLTNPNTRFRKILDKYCKGKQVSPNVIMEAMLPDTSLEFSRQGTACSIIPKLPLFYHIQNTKDFSQACVFEIDLDGCTPLSGAITIMYRDDIQIPDYVTHFVQCAKSVCKKLDKQVDSVIQSKLVAQESE